MTLQAVCTALDNVEARLYMDQRCVVSVSPAAVDLRSRVVV